MDAPKPAAIHPVLTSASIARRLISFSYESLLLAALLMLAGLVFAAVTHNFHAPWLRAALQGYLLAVAGAYFVRCWRRGGQTLPMKTWRLRVVSQDGRPLTMQRALFRYTTALLCVAPIALCAAAAALRHDLLLAAATVGGASLTFGWALLDRDRQFLYDRLAGTRVVNSHS